MKSVLRKAKPGTFHDRLMPGRYLTESASGAQLKPAMKRTSLIVPPIGSLPPRKVKYEYHSP